MNNVGIKKRGDEILTEAACDFLKMYAEEVEKFKKKRSTEDLTKEIKGFIFLNTIDVLYEKYKTPLKDWAGIETKFQFKGKINSKKSELKRGNKSKYLKTKRVKALTGSIKNQGLELEIPFLERVKVQENFFEISVEKPKRCASLEEEVLSMGLDPNTYF